MNHPTTGILIVSFGTSHADTRARTIQAIEEEVRKAYPDIPVYQAWTSHMIIRKLQDTTGESIPTVKEALDQMASDGIRQVYIQPTHIINGIENDRMIEDAQAFRDQFTSLSFGAPLLSSTEDLKETVRIIAKTYAGLNQDEALVLMGHGSDHDSNTAYAALDYLFKDMGYPHIHVGTVEAYPSLDQVFCRLKEHPARALHLAPLMIVAGDHARNDMAGESEDSWMSQCQKAGYPVTCHLKGLGEYPAIRRMFLSHLQAAMMDACPKTGSSR